MLRQDDEVPDVNLVLLRHGESEWNLANLFTGWVDVDLSETGEAEARRGAELLVEVGLEPDVVHTSLLRRAIRTANITLDGVGRSWIPVRRSWRLNERHYGALQGKDKAAVRAEFGDEQFMLWRRSYADPPPRLADDDKYSQVGDTRYADLLESVPRTECLADVVARLMPYWYDAIVPDLRDFPHRPHRRARQFAACAGQASGRAQRRRGRLVEHPHGHPAALPAGPFVDDRGGARPLPGPSGSGRGHRGRGQPGQG